MWHYTRSMPVPVFKHSRNGSKGKHVAEAPVDSTYRDYDHEVAEAHS